MAGDYPPSFRGKRCSMVRIVAALAASVLVAAGCGRGASPSAPKSEVDAAFR
jgi:hypothetical protein